MLIVNEVCTVVPCLFVQVVHHGEKSQKTSVSALEHSPTWLINVGMHWSLFCVFKHVELGFLWPKGGTEKPLRLAHPPFLVLARTTPTCVPRRASSETKKKYWACSNTGGATSPATMLMLTLALIGAVRPPPSWAETTIVMTEFAFPCKARDSEITPGRCTTKINVFIKLKGIRIHQAILNSEYPETHLIQKFGIILFLKKLILLFCKDTLKRH